MRLIESPSTEPTPTDTSTSPSLQLRLTSCESCESDRGHHLTEPEICGYYLAVSKTSQQHHTEHVALSDDGSRSDLHSSVDLTTETNPQPDTELAASSSSNTDVPAGVKATTGVMTDADVMSVESQAQSAAAAATSTQLPSSLPGNLLRGVHSDSNTVLDELYDSSLSPPLQ